MGKWSDEVIQLPAVVGKWSDVAAKLADAVDKWPGAIDNWSDKVDKWPDKVIKLPDVIGKWPDIVTKWSDIASKLRATTVQASNIAGKEPDGVPPGCDHCPDNAFTAVEPHEFGLAGRIFMVRN